METPGTDADSYANALAVGMAPMHMGGTFPFLYDYGDSWQFTIKLEVIHPVDPNCRTIRLVESHGTAPRQYDTYDEEDCDWD